VAALLILTSCTEVKDFGAYWGRGVVDPALGGTWQKIGLPGEPIDSTPGADVLVFATREDGSYSLQSINPVNPNLPPDVAAQTEQDNQVRLAVRTLKIGTATFLMVRPQDGDAGDGMIERYEIADTTLVEYRLNNAAAVDLLEAEYPEAENISKNLGEGRYVVIDTFDDEVFRVLSRIADDPQYWERSCQYKKSAL
jgi:hypothetical protein